MLLIRKTLAHFMCNSGRWAQVSGNGNGFVLKISFGAGKSFSHIEIGTSPQL